VPAGESEGVRTPRMVTYQQDFTKHVAAY